MTLQEIENKVKREFNRRTSMSARISCEEGIKILKNYKLDRMQVRLNRDFKDRHNSTSAWLSAKVGVKAVRKYARKVKPVDIFI